MDQKIGTLPVTVRRMAAVDWKLELIVVPVSDVDRAKAFYADKLGFHVDVDHSAGEDFRVVQLTPPGSACSVTLMRTAEMAPGSLHGLHIVVPDIEAARAELVSRGTDVSELYHFSEGGQTPGPDPDRADYNTFASIKDPDGNTLLLQEVGRARAEA
jgi:catechol 2,3-dioxygenase-like lactoylglutathione lyase family enzyme